MGPSLSRAADHRWWRSHEVDVVSDKATLELRNKIIQGGPKKRGHRLMTITLSILNRFNFFSLEHSLVYLQLMACFADINVSQGSVATYARCGWSFSIHLNVNLLRNLPVIFLSVKIRQNYCYESVALLLAHPVYRHSKSQAVKRSYMQFRAARSRCTKRLFDRYSIPRATCTPILSSSSIVTSCGQKKQTNIYTSAVIISFQKVSKLFKIQSLSFLRTVRWKV